jgi:hypothetical protein
VVDLLLSGSVLRDEVVLWWAVRPYLGLLLGGRGVDQRLVWGGTRVSRPRQAGCGSGSKLLCGRNAVAVGHGVAICRVEAGGGGVAWRCLKLESAVVGQVASG